MSRPIAHLAVYKLGAIAVPMSVLFGPGAIEHRLLDSEAKALILETDRMPSTEHVPAVAPITIGLGSDGATNSLAFWKLIEAASDRFVVTETSSEAGALIIYTSGTTGQPKGALHSHRVLIGHLPGFELSHDFFPQAGDRFWTPADWAWIAGLMNGLFCTWY